MMPLVESRLDTIYLEGAWVISEHDLSKVLSVYAHNLTTLQVDKIHAMNEQDEMHHYGLRFLKVVMDVIGSRSDSSQAETSTEEAGNPGPIPQAGWKLKSVNSKYSVNAEDAGNFGLVQDTREDDLKSYGESGIRMFQFKKIYLSEQRTESMTVFFCRIN